MLFMAPNAKPALKARKETSDEQERIQRRLRRMGVYSVARRGDARLGLVAST
jgi:hypothetical protein